MVLGLFLPIYGKATWSWIQRRNGNGHHNPSREFHELQKRVEVADRETAVLKEKVDRVEKRIDTISLRTHDLANQVTRVLMKLDME